MAGTGLDPISLALGGVGLVSNIIGGLFGGSAAKRAAAAQAQAAQAASDKVGVATGEANKGISDATGSAQALATAGANRVLDTAGQAKAVSDEAAKNANAILDPYSATGTQATQTLQAGLAPGGDFNKTPTLADLQMDPGYAFRLQQGQQALERSAAARGGIMSGAALKDLTNFSQGSASQEYQNAFNRFQTSTQNRFGNLTSAAAAGQAAGVTQGNNLTGAAHYGGDITTGAAGTALGANEFAGQVGMTGANEMANNITGGARTQADLLTQKGNAEASGIVGKTNAITGGISGGINAGMGGIALGNLLKNPATVKKGTWV